MKIEEAFRKITANGLAIERVPNTVSVYMIKINGKDEVINEDEVINFVERGGKENFNEFLKKASYKNFNDYLKIVGGITWEDYDNNYSGLQQNKIWDDFINYDGTNWESLCFSEFVSGEES